MFGLVTRLLGGVVTPLIDQVSASSGRLLRKLGLFAAAGACLLVTLVALTVAFALWISSLKGPIVGALAVAGLYFSVAAVAIIIALWPARRREKVGRRDGRSEQKPEESGDETPIDEFAAPLLGILQRLGLRREQLAVLAGASVAKQIGPVPLVGLAILAGFLIGRMGTALLSNDLVATLLASDLFSGLFRREPDAGAENPDADARDAA